LAEEVDRSGWRIHDNIVRNIVLGGFMLNVGLDNVSYHEDKEIRSMYDTGRGSSGLSKEKQHVVESQGFSEGFGRRGGPRRARFHR
jgi:hypothetical protein